MCILNGTRGFFKKIDFAKYYAIFCVAYQTGALLSFKYILKQYPMGFLAQKMFAGYLWTQRLILSQRENLLTTSCYYLISRSFEAIRVPNYYYEVRQ